MAFSALHLTLILTCLIDNRWAVELHDYVSIPVNNMALSGRSTRSFIYEGVWAKLVAAAKKDDFVIIEV